MVPKNTPAGFWQSPHLDLFKPGRIATVRLESSTRSDLVVFVRVVISELDAKGHFKRMQSAESFEVLPALAFDVAIALTRVLLRRGYGRRKVPRSFGPLQKWAKDVLRLARREEEQGHLFL